MADILQGNKREGYWASGDGGSDDPYYISPEEINKYDNLVLVDGEPFFGLLVIEREVFDTHVSGIVEMNGQRFPVWRNRGASGGGKRAHYGKPWLLGRWSPSVKARYWISLSCSLIEDGNGSKKEKAALAFLLEKGLDLKKVWVEPIWLYQGYVSLTHSDYEQVRHLNQYLNLFER